MPFPLMVWNGMSKRPTQIDGLLARTDTSTSLHVEEKFFVDLLLLGGLFGCEVSLSHHF
jgi:hypothetical protein